jgi:diketogulonate reductase-like aldo/keto reductase
VQVIGADPEGSVYSGGTGRPYLVEGVGEDFWPAAYDPAQVDEVVAVVRRIGDAHERTPSQVALRWLIEKGTVPIPGAKNAAQARENAGALGWSLTTDELAALDACALEGIRSLANRFWQHG